MTKYKVPKFLYVVLFLIVVTDLALTVWLILSKKKETTPSQETEDETQTTGGTTQTTGGTTQDTVGTTQDTVGESSSNKCTKYYTNCTKNPLEIDECRKYCKNLDDPDKNRECQFSFHCIKEWQEQCNNCSANCTEDVHVGRVAECVNKTVQYDAVDWAARTGKDGGGSILGEDIIKDQFCSILDDHGHLDKKYCEIDWYSNIDYSLCLNNDKCEGRKTTSTCCPDNDSRFHSCCSARSRTPKPSEPWCGLEDEGGCP